MQITVGQRRALFLAGVAILFGVLGWCVATGADRATTKAAWMGSAVLLVLLGAITLPSGAR